MKAFVLAGLMVAAFASAQLRGAEAWAEAGQEREVPKDSSLVTLRGCADGRNFVVGPRSEDQPGTLEIEPGRRLRLNGPGKVLDEIKKRERMMVEVTGLVKKSQVNPGGIAVAGGRIRIGGTVPQSPINDPRRDPAYNQTILDVQSYRPLPDPCPDR
jgi:hypothetical protein